MKCNFQCSKWWAVIKHWWHHTPTDEASFSDVLKTAEENGLINHDTLSMIESMMQLSKLKVRDVMLPKTQMICLSSTDHKKNVIDIIINSGHSRFPVTNEKGDIIGILHAKDLLKYDEKDDENFDLEDRVRLAVLVPESKRLDLLLGEFRTNRNHMALVVDEYGKINGFITIEDIIEQIIGDIEDEFDIDEAALIQLHRNQYYTIKSQLPISEFNTILQANFSDDTYETLGGFVMAKFGHVPKQGEMISLEGFEFRVLIADTRRIKLLACIDKRAPTSPLDT